MSAFIAPRVGQLIGGERGLRQTLEGIRQCAALRGRVDTKGLAEWVAGKGR
jgi:alanyl aminopeptidase